MNKGMKYEISIRRATLADSQKLVDVWQQSARATHTFLTEADIQSMLPQVAQCLASDAELWVACNPTIEVVGFMGLSERRIDSLFLHPSIHRRGVGRQLIAHAKAIRCDLTVDVNEQNPSARAFYEACGFIVEGRSAFDDEGRPFPLLHMRMLATR
jgi:putative acetyltransferase